MAQRPASLADSPGNGFGKLNDRLAPSHEHARHEHIRAEHGRSPNLRSLPGESHEVTVIEPLALREPPATRLGSGAQSASGEVPTLLRLIEAEQTERARLLDQLQAEQAANSQMRRLIGQFLAARERERGEWQMQLTAARDASEAAQEARQQETAKHQRAVTEILTMEERFKTHKTHWIMERRRLQATIEAMDTKRPGRRWLGFLFRR